LIKRIYYRALGQGAFGEVYQGFYRHRDGDAVEMPVAVKVINRVFIRICSPLHFAEMNKMLDKLKVISSERAFLFPLNLFLNSTETGNGLIPISRKAISYPLS
jgi:serine/threonine protein kinase